MPPSFNNFTTKAKEVIRRAHELAIERGQNQVSPLHLMGALLTQEESLVHAILEKLEIDVIHLTDSIIDAIEVRVCGQVDPAVRNDWRTEDLLFVEAQLMNDLHPFGGRFQDPPASGRLACVELAISEHH